MMRVAMVMVVVMSPGPGRRPPQGGRGGGRVSLTSGHSTVRPSVTRGTVHRQSGIYGNIPLAVFSVPIPHPTGRHGDQCFTYTQTSLVINNIYHSPYQNNTKTQEK